MGELLRLNNQGKKNREKRGKDGSHNLFAAENQYEYDSRN